MIPQKEKSFEIKSGFEGADHRMGIAKEFEGHVMDMLATLYSNPKQAVLREYCTNARDAHIEVGSTAAIEVTLPGPLSSVLSIKDYGVGLSEEDIASIYSQYGASTKRGTNDQNGTFGIGCKSAFAYADQFTVVSTKNGEQLTVVVSRESDGGGNMKVLQRVKVDTPDGTEVQIPAKRGDNFVKEADELFRYAHPKYGWPRGSVLVNGSPPNQLDGLWIDEDLCIIEGDYYNSAPVVVMSGVPYPVDEVHFDTGLPHSSRLVMFVPNGSVGLVPTREALKYNDLTKKALAGLKIKFEAACKGRVQEEIDKAKNPVEARRTMNVWHNKLPSFAREASYKYKGAEIPSALAVDTSKPDHPMLITTDRSAYRLSSHDKNRPFPIESFDKALFVQNYDRPSFTPGQKKKLNHWLESQNGTAPDPVRMYVLYGGKLDGNEWIDQSRVIEWKTIEDVKLPRTVGAAKGTSGRIPGSYDLFEDDATNYRQGVPGDDIDQTKPIFYYIGSEWDYSFARALKLDHSKFVLVRLTANREDKFKRLFPTATKARDHVQAQAKKWFAGLGKDVVLALQLQQTSLGSRYQQLDGSRLDDPKLKRFALAARRNVTGQMKRLEAYSFCGSIEGYSTDVGDHPLTSYPLLRSVYGVTDLRGPKAKDHMYLYLNAAYAADKKGV